MNRTVLAEQVRDEDVVLLHNRLGTTRVRVERVDLRVHGVKITGRDEAGTPYSFGARHGEPLTLVDGTGATTARGPRVT